MAVRPPWRGRVNTHGFILDGKSYRQGPATTQTPNNPAVSSVRIIMHMQPYYYRVRQVKPCHLLGEVAGRSS